MSMMIYLQTIETGEDKTKFEQIYAEYRGLMFHVAYEVLIMKRTLKTLHIKPL